MTTPSTTVAIIGTGFGGQAALRALQQAGIDDVVLLERRAFLGGTWKQNTYPGAAVDVQSPLYSLSGEPWDWSRMYAEQAELAAYTDHLIDTLGIRERTWLGANVIAVTWHADDQLWDVEIEDGRRLRARFVVNASGPLSEPLIPDFPGRDTFEGPSWHTNAWNHEVDLAGKRVVIVGSAAAAVQIVPKVAEAAGHLTVLQRTPNWIMPRNWKAYSPRMLAMFRRFPALTRLWRWGQGLLMGVVLDGVTLGHKRMEQFEARVHKFIASAIDDPEVQKAVTPNTRYGCKRGLVSDEFYPTLNRDNVELVAEGLAAVRLEGITTASGREIDADVIVYCTGYQVMDFDRIDVRGTDDKVLGDVMNDAPQAYLGIAAPHFPNYFFAAGPNGIPIDTSYFTTVERNTKTIVSLLEQMRDKGVQAIAVSPETSAAYNRDIAPAFATYSWGHASCNSYYRTEEGFSPFLFPGGYKDYAARHEACDLGDFETA